MKKTLTKLTALVCAAVLLLCCTACGVGLDAITYDTIPDSTEGKDVVRAEAADKVFTLNSNSKYSFNPIIATNHSNQLICSLVYENMLEVDNNFNAQPNIIIDWKYTDEEGKNWVFTIDTTHTFHDGTPLTAKDLRYSLERAISSDRFSGRFTSFQGASYLEDTLYVTLGIGDTQFYKLMNIPVVQYGTYGDDYPGGSGPYMYNEDYTQLLAYENYVGILRSSTEEEEDKETATATPEPTGVIDPDAEEETVKPLSGHVKPSLDVIYIQEIQDVDGIISAFEDGTIDLVVNDPSSYTNLGYASTNEIHTYATTNMHFVAFNEAGTLTSWPTFRAAMQYAFDRSYLVELLQGNGVKSAVPMYPTAEDYPQTLADSYDYSLETCVTVLENAGIRDYDDDGLREYMSGSPQEIELSFLVCSDSSAKTGVVHRFVEDMASIGITVLAHEVTWDEYMTALKEGEFDLYYGEVKLRNNFDLTELLQVRDDVDEDDTDKGNTLTNINFTNSKDAMYESYVNSYLRSTDLDRALNYRTLCEYIFSSGGFVTIGFERQQLICHRAVIRDADPNMGNPLYDFANWRIDLE